MTEKKKMGAGLVLSVITVLVTVAAGSVHDELQNKLFCKNYWY